MNFAQSSGDPGRTLAPTSAKRVIKTDHPTLARLLFPASVPILWSSTLVLYDEAGIDRGRQLAHLAFMYFFSVVARGQ
jgi:hypothetical protein